jgi:hypothetical protein
LIFAPFTARLNNLVKKSIRGWNWRERNPAGAKALNCFVAITARLKPCPCYKTCTDGGPNEFFTKLFSRALTQTMAQFFDELQTQTPAKNPKACRKKSGHWGRSFLWDSCGS